MLGSKMRVKTALLLFCICLLTSVRFVKSESSYNTSIDELERTLERVTNDLGLCQATSIAVETREMILKQELDELNQTCNTSKQECKQTQENLIIEIQNLQNSVRDLSSDNDNNNVALQQEINTLMVQLENVLNEKNDMENSLRKQITTLEQNLSETQTSLNTIETTTKIEKDTLIQTIRDMEDEISTMKVTAENEKQNVIKDTIKKHKEETIKQVQFWKKQNDRTQNDYKELLSKHEKQEIKLNKVQTELLIVRKELFQLKEKVHNDEIRRKWIIIKLYEYYNIIKSIVLEIWNNHLKQYYIQYCIPYIIEPTKKYTMMVKTEFQTHYPIIEKRTIETYHVIKERAVPMYETTKAAVVIQSKHLWNTAQPHIKQAKVTMEPHVQNAKSVIEPHVQNARTIIEPKVQEIWKNTQSHRNMIYEQYVYYARTHPRTVKMHKNKLRIDDYIANVLYVITDNMLSYCKKHNWISSPQPILKYINTNTNTIVHYTELVLLVIIIWKVIIKRLFFRSSNNNKNNNINYDGSFNKKVKFE